MFGTLERDNTTHKTDRAYYETNDVFYAPKPFESWTLDTDTWQWVCPITYPNDDKMYTWDEDVYQADNSKGWVLND